MVIDDIFPNPEKSSNYLELLSYLESFRSIRILRTCPYDQPLENKIVDAQLIDFKRKFPQFGNKVAKYIALDYINCKLLYLTSLVTALIHLDLLDQRGIPFIFPFELENGLELYISHYDEILKRVMKSPCFKKVIVTQRSIYNYLIDNNLCETEKIEFIDGTVNPMNAKIQLLMDNI